MKGDRLYIFHCGCMVYELTHKYKLRWVCPKHGETLKKIHGFCEVCGLDMEFPPKGARKKLCDYTMLVKNKRGLEYSEVNGCAGMRQREQAAHNYRRHNPIILKEPKNKKRVKTMKVDQRFLTVAVKSSFKRHHGPWKIPKTPVIDKLYAKKFG